MRFVGGGTFWGAGLLMIGLLLAGRVQAQDVHVTLTEWAAEKRIFLLDRSHALGDRLYDRGVFRHITPLTDREYRLDLLGYRFTPAEDFHWSQSADGVRVRAGSISRARWAIVTEIKKTFSIDERQSFRVAARMQQDPHAQQRAFVEMGYRWAFYRNHALGARHTFSEYKPDLDLTLFYEYGGNREGRVRAGIVFQDLYNNLIYNQLGVQEEDIVRDYRRKPYLLTFQGVTPTIRHVRAEVVAGVQPERRTLYHSKSEPAYRYGEDEAIYYVGGLLEFSHPDYLTAGAMYLRDRSHLRRTGRGGAVASQYAARQMQERIGLFALRTWKQFRAEVWFWAETYRDRQTGEEFDLSLIDSELDYRETRRNLKARMVYEPPRPWPFVGLEYLAGQRTLGEHDQTTLARQWTQRWFTLGPSNYRAVAMIGYRIGADASGTTGAVVLGIGYDTDGDTNFKESEPSRFDNGFLRLSLTW